MSGRVGRSGRLRRGERGAALSSPTAVLSVAVVLAAGVAFVLTDHDDQRAGVTPAAARVVPSSTAAPTRPPAGKSAPAPKPKPKRVVVHRGEVYVEVFNNSGIHGLAGSTAARAQGAGWQVVGSDNWYGTIPASTVYYPARLKAAARVLGKDLGIGRTQPLIAPMRGDRLTVILTSDYS